MILNRKKIVQGGGDTTMLSGVIDGSATEIVIPEGAKSLRLYCFYGLGFLKRLTIPHSVIKIENYAFSNCYNSSWEPLILPDSIISIGNYAFQKARIPITALPSSLTNLGISAFYGASKVTFSTVPAGVTSLSTNAFRDCVAITTFSVPDTVVEIAGSVFSGCTSLTSLSLPAGVKLTTGSFGSCAALETLTVGAGFDSDMTLSTCPAVSLSSLQDIITNYKDNSSTGVTRILTLSVTAYAQITDEMFSEAKAKGLTIASG